MGLATHRASIPEALDWWKKQLGYCTLADVSKALIIEKRDMLHNTPKKTVEARTNATINRYMMALSHVFTIALKE